jgi:hypothetical protein
MATTEARNQFTVSVRAQTLRLTEAKAEEASYSFLIFKSGVIVLPV